MKLSQGRAVVSVADTGSFTAAAKLIGVSQSAVSHAVTALEKELGTQLFERGNGQVALTAAGRLVLQSARKMLHHAQEIEAIGSRVMALVQPRLRVGVGRAFGRRLLPRLLSELGDHRPDLILDVRVAPCAEVQEWAQRGLVDVAIGTLNDRGNETAPVLRDTMQVVVPAGHPLGAATAVHARQLTGETLLVPSESLERRLRSHLQTHGVFPHTGLHVGDTGSLLALTADGHGLTVLPGVAVPAKALRVRVLPLVPTMPCNQFLSISEAGDANRFTEEFVGLLKKFLSRREGHVPAWTTAVTRPTANTNSRNIPMS
jgi:DNA-binding transcriptional LysR family regulator